MNTFLQRKNFGITSMIVVILAIIFSHILLFAQEKSGFHIAKRIAIGGEGGWDYLTFDSKSRRLFVSHNDRVVVIDADSNKIVGEIRNLDGVHGITIANESGQGFISNGRSSKISVFDLKTLNVLKEIPAGKNPDAILFDAFSHCVFAFNGRSQDVTVLDAEKLEVVSTFPVDGKPEFAVTDGKGHIFVNIEDKSEVLAFDAKSLKILARWPLKPGEEPSGFAIDIEHHRLFSVCGNKLMIVLDSDSGRVIASLPTGGGTDGCAFDPQLGLAFASNGEGTITVIRADSPATYSVVENVPTQRGARTIAIDPAKHVLYVPTAEFGPTPAPTQDHPRPRPSILPNSFIILQVNR